MIGSYANQYFDLMPVLYLPCPLSPLSSISPISLLVLASTSLPVEVTERLEPWDLPNLVEYDESYLSGFKAEHYGVELEEGFDLAKGKMAPTIEASIRTDIGGDHQRITSYRTRYDNITYKHILLPIWVSAYRHDDKVYRFVVNGRTGEVQGERPYSVIKIALAVLGGLAVIGAIAYAFALQS